MVVRYGSVPFQAIFWDPFPLTYDFRSTVQVSTEVQNLKTPQEFSGSKEFNKFVVFNPKNHQQYFVNLFDPPFLAHYKWVPESGESQLSHGDMSLNSRLIFQRNALQK